MPVQTDHLRGAQCGYWQSNIYTILALLCKALGTLAAMLSMSVSDMTTS